MTFIATMALVWYALGLLVTRFIQPYWPTCEVLLAAPFWPLILLIEWRESRWLQKEIDRMEERHRLEETWMILLIGSAIIKVQEALSQKKNTGGTLE